MSSKSRKLAKHNAVQSAAQNKTQRKGATEAMSEASKAIINTETSETMTDNNQLATTQPKSSTISTSAKESSTPELEARPVGRSVQGPDLDLTPMVQKGQQHAISTAVEAAKVYGESYNAQLGQCMTEVADSIENLHQQGADRVSDFFRNL